MQLPLGSYQDAFDSAVAGSLVLHWGREIDLSGAWRNIRRQVTGTIVGGVIAAWERQIDKLAMTAFAGGGSLVLFDVLNRMFPCPVLVRDGYYANAVGFLKMSSER